MIISSRTVCLLSLLRVTVVLGDLTDDQHTFADTLCEQMYQNENECSSSWGLSMAPSLIYPVSIGNSEIQLQTLLGFPTESKSTTLVWNETASRLDATYEGECTEIGYDDSCAQTAPSLEIANSIWIDDGTNLNPVYSDIIGDSLYQIDFSDDGAGGEINTWIDKSTNGRIGSVMPEGSLTPLLLVAINSIYLKASWSSQFGEGVTNEDIYYTSASRATAVDEKVHFMHKVKEFDYSHDALPGFQIVRLFFTASLAYSDRYLSMLFVLPTSETSGLVSSVEIIEALPKLVYTKIALALPKFKFESEYKDSLMTSLKSVGLTAPFEGGLCLYDNDCSASISTIIKKTCIDVNEKGVEAAAVTALLMGAGRPVPEKVVSFTADYPFQFFIYDQAEDIVFFEGRVGLPSIPEDADPAQLQLQAAHSDTDFWRRFGDYTVIPPPEVTLANTTKATPPPTGNNVDSSRAKSTNDTFRLRWFVCIVSWFFF